MKRLVVCCDGTWGSESNPAVSNVVKIAESVRLNTSGPDGRTIGQRVFYADGPGSHGYLVDKYLGGMMGLGLDAALSDMYWQLVLNWEPDDEIFIFGFSRGAYLARSLSGLINRIGLLTRDALGDGRLPEALRIFRQRKAHPDDPDPQDWARFREQYCHAPVPIKFLGVFDTVGAMGVPGITAGKYKFHDLRLAPIVHCARQALSIDDRRRLYSPCLWEVTDQAGVTRQRPDRVKQVWFEGGHTDIGGGLPDGRLSERTLRWMVREACEQGLEIDEDRLEELIAHSVTAGGPVLPHVQLNLFYRVANFIGFLVHPRDIRFYRDSWRRLEAPPDQRVYLASCVHTDGEYDPPNVRRWAQACGDCVPTEHTAGHAELDAEAEKLAAEDDSPTVPA